jgi:hypothetical protein
MPAIGFAENHERWYGSAVISILIIAGVAAARRRRALFVCSATIGAVAIVIRWIALWNPSPSWSTRADVATLVSILVISSILLLRIFRRRGAITSVTIQAAISVYLLFGIAWAYVYLFVMQIDPHSFRSIDGVFAASPTEWLYYSYVTLTTLGYGEITPVSQIARTLSVGEALTGQLYLAVLIARLIGLEILSYQERSARSGAR